MTIANSLVLPNSFANGQTSDAPAMMADLNYLLAALNRTLIDSGGGAGLNAQAQQIHNLTAGSATGDAATYDQLITYLPLAGGTLTGGLAGTTLAMSGAVSGGAASFTTLGLSGALTGVNATLSGLLATAASGTGSAGLRLPHGVAPASPTNGDLWTTTAGVFARVNGVTQGPLLDAANLSPTGTVTLAAGTTSLVPMKFQTGSLTTTPVAGGAEFDGRVFYESFSTSNRMISHNAMTFADPNTYTGLTATSPVRAFRGLANGQINLPVGLYRLRLLVNWGQGGGSPGGTLSFGGTMGAFGRLTGIWRTWDGVSSGGGGCSGEQLNTYTISVAGNALALFWFDGFLAVLSAGTIIPLIQTGISFAASAQPGCFMEVIPIAANQNNAFAIGDWS